jgi:hypothetical protein
MIKLIILFAHLLSTCLAIGTIIATDIKLLRELSDNRVHIAPPEPFVMRIITIALSLLYVTGAGLIFLGINDNPAYLENPKLQAKLILVGALTINAIFLHYITFPRLTNCKWVSKWRTQDYMVIAIPIALSNSLWMFCAFLGIARPWNFHVSISFVLFTASLLFLSAFSVVGTTLAFASLERRSAQQKVLGTVKRALSACASALHT